ncbi:SH3 domain-containing protein [Atopomonas hussainii]|uniref:SH3 domain-containing protein n=1 Tax=Atopomonas hussainii TaxID=1429083 RepID=UPI0008FFF6A5|nr:SH3 domain-containing protein [Atopomonas hussainii]
MKVTLPLAGLLFALTALLSHAWANQAAFTSQATQLRLTPTHQASAIQALPANQSLTLLKREGGWYQVKLANGQEGWLPLLHVRLAPSNNQQRSDLGQLLGSTSASQGSTLSSGVRGVNEEQLSGPSSNLPADLQPLDRYRANAEQARAFAAQAPLRSETLDYPR